MAEVFISYKQEERERMRPIANALTALGVDVWFDARLQPGKAFTDEIVEEIESCRAQIVCWSPAAVKSEWVRGEADIGRQRGVLVSVVIEPCRLVPPFNMLHAENLSDWKGQTSHESWIKVLQALTHHLGRELTAQAAAKPAVTSQTAGAARVLLPEMVRVPGGEFMMGAPKNEPNSQDDERPQHKVRVGAFSLAKYPVTFGEWDAAIISGAPLHKPHDPAGRDRRPVVGVSWQDAQSYISWLNAQTDGGYRMPSEAEWEYACRAGTTTPFSTGASITASQACFEGVSTPAVVGSFHANSYGLHDMHGGVREWVEDCWHETYKGAPADGSAWLSGADCSLRVCRGGSWRSRMQSLRSASRSAGEQSARSNLCGFRLARSA